MKRSRTRRIGGLKGFRASTRALAVFPGLRKEPADGLKLRGRERTPFPGPTTVAEAIASFNEPRGVRRDESCLAKEFRRGNKDAPPDGCAHTLGAAGTIMPQAHFPRV